MNFKDLFSVQLISDYLTSRNNVAVPPGNLGIPRSQMPQIKDFDKFKKILEGMGISIKTVRLRVGDLKLVQNEVNKDKVFKMMLKHRSANRRTRGGVEMEGFPPVISNDKYVLDGLHRQVAMYNINRHAYQDYTSVDYPIKELYSLIKNNQQKFAGCVEYKGLQENSKSL